MPRELSGRCRNELKANSQKKLYTTAIAVFISCHPVHMEDRRARSENDITSSTSDILISWSVITDSAPSEQKNLFSLWMERHRRYATPAIHYWQTILKGELLHSDDPELQLATAEAACSFLKQIWILWFFYSPYEKMSWEYGRFCEALYLGI